MADLLAKWLNEDIKLSTTVTDFEKDFANGYLFGELLHKFNQLDNFSDFSQLDIISSKVQNFEKLEPTLRNLNIKFDSQLVDRIMKKERGYALRLLYQIKMILEKVYPPTDITILKKTGKLGDAQPALKIGSNKQAYNQMQSQFFKTRLQTLNKPQKSMNMDHHLSKYQEEAVRQQEDANRFEKSLKDEKERVRQEVRRAQINKLQRNAGFMEEWLAKGVEDWKQNMAYKKEREQSQLEFEYKHAQKINQAAIEKIEDATREVIEGIEQFERTLQDNGINPRVTKNDADRALTQSANWNATGKTSLKTHKVTQSLLSRPTMGIGGTMTKTGGVTLASVGLRSKAKKPLDEKGKKEKERRRMRMIASQMTLLQDMEKSRREEEVLQRLKRQAKQEEELGYEAWRTNQCRQVIKENRKLREAKYDKRQELDTQNAIFKEKHMLDSMVEQMNREITSLQTRDHNERQKDQEAQKVERILMAKEMVDAIFEMAHQAYVHKQKNDSAEVDQRCWREWEQLFIAGTSSTSVGSESATNLDYLELVDYLENQGQWPLRLISENKPDIEALFSGGHEPPAAGKGKAPPKAAPADHVALEEGDTHIPDRPENNYLVGDAVERIINLNFEARGPQLRPKIPHYLNLKLCFIGYAFAGKKLQAMKVKQEYGLDSISMNDLVEEALKFFQDHPNPIVNKHALEASPIQESLHEESRDDVPHPDHSAVDAQLLGDSKVENQDEKPPAEEHKHGLRPNPQLLQRQSTVLGNQDDVKSVSSEIEEELNPEEDFRKCGEKIQQFLYEGAEIPDQLYVDLFVAKLRISYQYKDKSTLRQKLVGEARAELDLTRAVADLEEELRQMELGEEVKDGKKKKRRTVETVRREIEEAQSKLAAIRSIDNNGWILIDFPSTLSQAMLLEKALSGYQMEAELEPTQREIEAEQAGLLVKPTEKPVPPKRLIPSGIDAVVWFDCEKQECLRRALGRRIDGVNNVIYHIQDNPPSIEKSPLCEVIEPIDDESESTFCLVDRWMAFDQTKTSLENWIQLFGDELNKRNLLKRIKASGDINSVFEQIDEVIQEILKNKMALQQTLRSKVQSQIIKEEEMAQQEGKETSRQEDVAKQSKHQETTKPSGVETSLVTAESLLHERDNIESEFKGVLMGLWKKTSTNYKEQMMKVLGKQKIQRETMQEYLYEVQTKFLAFLRRQDKKQSVLDKFVKEFNDYSDKFPDMREDDSTKEELHQRVDILSDELWEIAEERKEQAVDERKKIIESGWIEFQQEYLTSCALNLMQSEIDKFKGSVQLIHDYYHAIEEKIIPELPEHLTVDLDKIEGDLPEVEKLNEGSDPQDSHSYNYPRLEDIYKRAFKAQIVPDLITPQSGGAIDPKAKGAPAKKDPKAKTGAPEPEETKQETIFTKEMKEAVKVEKANLRFRLTQIRNWALKWLRYQRQQAIKVYQKLEDWINVSSKAENDGIEEVCDVLKEAIEEESKIQHELRIRYMDFFVDKSVMNFIEPPPEKLDAMERVVNDRFSIPQLKCIVQELRMLVDSSGRIPNRQFVSLMVRKVRNSRSFGDGGSLPKDWFGYKQEDFERMTRNLDNVSIGSVDFQVLAICLILLKSTFPNKDEIQSVKTQIKSTILNQTQFSKSEKTQDREYSHPFPRVGEIKDLLFSLLSQNGQIDMNQFLEVVQLKEVRENQKSYRELLVGRV